MNAIPLELIQKTTYDRGSVQPNTHVENDHSSLPGYIFRAEGPQVRLCEVMLNPSGADKGAEWAAIYNNGSDAASLSGWGLTNRDGETDALLPDWNLPADSTLYIHFGLGENDADFEDYVGHYYTQNPFEIFNNSADTLALYNGASGNDTILDYVCWKDSSDVSFTGGRTGEWAMEAGIWPSGDYIPSEGFSEGSSLGRTNILPTLDSSNDWESGRLVINEVMFYGDTNPAGSDVGNEMVEIYNPTDATVSTIGWSLKVDGGGEFLLESFEIAPRSFVVIHLVTDSSIENDTDLGDGKADLYYTVNSAVLGNARGAIGLYSPQGPEDYVAWGTGGSNNVASDAVGAGIWTQGTSLTGNFLKGDSIGRDQFSTDTNIVADWSRGGGLFSNGPTIGLSNYYSLMIWDADLFADAGEEWIKISNYGDSLNVDGWVIYNREGTAVATLPALELPGGSTLTINFGVGVDDLDFSDYDGSFYVSGSSGSPPASKFFNSSLDIILITTGDLDGDSTVGFEIWFENGFSDRGTRGWFSDAWNAVKNAGKWVAKKVEQAVSTVVDGVLKATKWLKEKIGQAQAWVLAKIKGGLSFEISLGDYLTLSLTTLAMGWRFHAEANAEFNIPVPGFPILQLHFAAQGSITIVRDCGGQSASGQIVITVGVNLGANIKKLFTLELRAHLRLTITVGNLDIDDYCNPDTHQGTVSVGLDIALDLVLGATFKVNTPEFELFDNDWDWNLAQFKWSQEKQYECCRDPKPKPGPKPGPLPEPPSEPSTPYYCPDEGCSVYIDYHVTNTDSEAHDYYTGGTLDTPGWELHYSMDYELNVQPGESVNFYPYLTAPADYQIPHTFEPNVGLSSIPGEAYARSLDRSRSPESVDISGDDYVGAPGSTLLLNFYADNMFEDIFLLGLNAWIVDNSTPPFNSSLDMSASPERVNITAFTENRWTIQVYNEDSAEINEDFADDRVFPITNFEGTREFTVVVNIPVDAIMGSVETLTFGLSTFLPNSTGLHTDNISAKIRVGEKVEEPIWFDDLENEGTLAGWNNTTGQWVWGPRLGQYADYQPGPGSDEPGPNIWSTNNTGNAEQMLSILETPAFDLSGYDSVSLRFRQWIRGWADIEIYANSSGLWHKLEDLNSMYLSDWEYVSYDLSPFLSGSVSIIFYYNAKNGDYPGWHIDDISFIGIQMGKVIIHEELEDETAAEEDWDNSTGEWEWGLMGANVAGPPLEGPYSNMWGTLLNDSATEETISILSSPFYDLTGYEVVNLRLWHWISAIGTMEIYVNSSGIQSLIGNWSGNHYWQDWEFDIIDISEYLSDQVQFIFFFNASLTRSGNWGWFINNISLATTSMSDVLITNATPLVDGGLYAPGLNQITINVENQGDIGYNDLTVGLLPVNVGRKTVFSDDFQTDKNWNTGDGAWNRDDDINFGAEDGYSLNIGGATEGSKSRSGLGSDVLISPVINLSGVDDPVLTFRENSWFDSGVFFKLELYLSDNAGVNWSAVPVWVTTENSHGAWDRVSIPLEPYGTSGFTMKFVLARYLSEGIPFIIIDDIEITVGENSDLNYVTDVIGTLGPGEDENVTLDMFLTEEGFYEIEFFVNCSKDDDLSNNHEGASIIINQMPTPVITDPSAAGDLSGVVTLEMEYRDTDTTEVRYHYRSAVRGDNLTLIGVTDSPDSNMVWSVEWDLGELENGDYVIVVEVVDTWGGITSASIEVPVWNPVGTINANFTHEEITGKPGAFSFTDTSEATPAALDIVGYYWDFGDGTDSCLASPRHAYQEDGTYVFYHSVTGANGITYAVQAPVVVIGTQVIPDITANFTFVPGTGVTRLTDVQFNDTSLIGTPLILTRKWSFGDGNISSNVSPVHRYSELGEYTVNLTLTDEWGNQWIHLADLEVTNILPQANFTFAPLAARVNETVTFTAGGGDEDGNISSWVWDFGDGTTGAGRTVTHLYRTSQKYTIELNMTDNDGGWSSISKNLFIFDSDTTILDVIEVRMGEVRHLTYPDPSGSFIKVSVSGDGTLVAARVDEDTAGIEGDPDDYIRISFYLRLQFDGDLNWTNITISFADMPKNESLDYSKATIFYHDGIKWNQTDNTGVDWSNQVVWANVSHFTIFAAFAIPEEESGTDTGPGGEEEKEAWYKSGTGLIIIGIVILLIIVMLGVLIYVKVRKGREEDEDEEDKEKIAEAGEVIKDIREKDDDLDEEEKVPDEDLDEDDEEKPPKKVEIVKQDILPDGAKEEEDIEETMDEMDDDLDDKSPEGKSPADAEQPDTIEEEPPMDHGEVDEVEAPEPPELADDLGDIEIVEETPDDAPTLLDEPEPVDDLDDIVVAGETSDDAPVVQVAPEPIDDLDDIEIAGETPDVAPAPPSPQDPLDDLDDIEIAGETPDEAPALPSPQEPVDDLDEIEIAGETPEGAPAPPGPQEPVDDLDEIEISGETPDEAPALPPTLEPMDDFDDIEITGETPDDTPALLSPEEPEDDHDQAEELTEIWGDEPGLMVPEEDADEPDGAEEVSEVWGNDPDPVQEDDEDIDVMALFDETDDVDGTDEAEDEEYDELDDIEVV
ncbi:MAG: PKD domain-containing protein [Candidatus Thermoplasmatota archaeon]|nr:PKD domain-containing protein [Candidatus Thermoplasmatota archaeon]